MGAHDYAVAVGINKYPELGDLDGAENDATAFATWLAAPTGGALPSRQVKLIRSSDYGRTAQRNGPRPEVDDLRKALFAIRKKGSPGDKRVGRRLYLYFAGHGFAPGTSSAALFSANALRDDPQHFPAMAYADWFYQSAMFEEIVLVLDCCRDDRPDIPQTPCPWPAVSRGGDAAQVRRLYFLGAKWSRKTREAEYGGVVYGRFSHALLACLDAGRVNGEELRNYVYSVLKADPKGEYQDPDVLFADRQIVLSESAERPSLGVTISFATVPPGARVMLAKPDGTLEVLDTGGAVERRLSVGLYTLIHENAGATKQFEVLPGGSDHVEF